VLLQKLLQRGFCMLDHRRDRPQRVVEIKGEGEDQRHAAERVIIASNIARSFLI